MAWAKLPSLCVVHDGKTSVITFVRSIVKCTELRTHVPMLNPSWVRSGQPA